MKLRPFTITLKPNQVAMISECEGAFVVEPMQFLYPYQARREVQAEHPGMCHHKCRKAQW